MSSLGSQPGENSAGSAPINEAGVPRINQLFAVFDTADAADQAARSLQEVGLTPQRLEGPADAQALQEPRDDAGVLKKLERAVKFVGGESNEALRYARHLEEGKLVLAMPVPNREVALQATERITAQHGYDISYFREWGIENTAPEANAIRGLPTHSETNTD